MKAASHDLKGLAAYLHTGISALHVPLMALVDFNGYTTIDTTTISSVLILVTKIDFDCKQ
jgi:hypothetical protein